MAGIANEAEPVPVVNRSFSTDLRAEDLDRNVAQFLASQFLCLEVDAQLRGEVENIFDLAEQDSVSCGVTLKCIRFSAQLLDLCIGLIDSLTERLALPTGQFKELGGEHIVGGGHAGTVGTAPDDSPQSKNERRRYATRCSGRAGAMIVAAGLATSGSAPRT